MLRALRESIDFRIRALLGFAIDDAALISEGHDFEEDEDEERHDSVWLCWRDDAWDAGDEAPLKFDGKCLEGTNVLKVQTSWY